MNKKHQLQHKIRFNKFLVESLTYNCPDNLNATFSDELEIDLEVDSAFSDDNLKTYLIKMSLELKSSDDKFNLKCKAIGIFNTEDEIDDTFKKSPFITINSPAILFPFVRSFINTITTNAGLPPLILPSINFSNQ